MATQVIFIVYTGSLLTFCPCYSRYEEDVHPGNHNTVWGSYWKDDQWGYRCCRSTIKNCFCTGDRVKDVKDSVSAALMQPPASPSKSSSGATKAQKKKKKMNLAEALKEEEHRLIEADRMLAMDERKRPYNSMIKDQAPSEVEMDAYRMKRKRNEDPMSHFM